MESIMSNEIKKGDKVILCKVSMVSDLPRRGEVICNAKGIRRIIQIEGNNGYYSEAGSTFIDEIICIYRNDIPHDIVFTPGHAKQLKKMRSLWVYPK